MIAPDVGGGFGYKGILLPEEVCISWLAMRTGRPVRWGGTIVSVQNKEAETILEVLQKASQVHLWQSYRRYGYYPYYPRFRLGFGFDHRYRHGHGLYFGFHHFFYH